MHIIKENKVLYLILFFYMFFLSWNNFIIYSDIFRFYLFFPALLLVYFIISTLHKKKVSIKLLDFEDVFLVAMLLSIFTTSIFHQTFNAYYLLTYVGIIILFYFLPKLTLTSKKSVEILFIVNSYSVILTLCITLLHFIIINNLGIDFLDVLTKLNNPVATYLGIFIRNYGFSDEPGTFAFYLGTMGVIGIWYFNNFISKNKTTKLLVLLLFILTYASTFSAAGIAALMTGYFGVLLSVIYLKNLKKMCSLLLLIVPVVIFALVFDEYLINIYMKLWFSEDNTSATIRLNHWIFALESIKENLFIGVGAGQSNNSPLSFYLLLLSQNGILSFIFFVGFIIFKYIRIFSYKEEGLIFLFVLLVSSVHLGVISLFYYPYLFLVSLMSKLYKVYLVDNK
jgi:hypothetical protein